MKKSCRYLFVSKAHLHLSRVQSLLMIVMVLLGIPQLGGLLKALFWYNPIYQEILKLGESILSQ